MELSVVLNYDSQAKPVRLHLQHAGYRDSSGSKLVIYYHLWYFDEQRTIAAAQAFSIELEWNCGQVAFAKRASHSSP